jgi:hypothetical protein
MSDDGVTPRCPTCGSDHRSELWVPCSYEEFVHDRWHDADEVTPNNEGENGGDLGNLCAYNIRFAKLCELLTRRE